MSLSDEIAVIFDGRLIQVATPHVLYNRPVNMQVAKFVGDANFLPAEAHGMTADSRLGEVKLFHPKTGRVQLMIRPEALAVGLDEEGRRATALWREFTTLSALAGFGGWHRANRNSGRHRYYKRATGYPRRWRCCLAYDDESQHVLS